MTALSARRYTTVRLATLMTRVSGRTRNARVSCRSCSELLTFIYGDKSGDVNIEWVGSMFIFHEKSNLLEL